MTLPDWIDIGALTDIPLRGGRVVKTPRGCIAVFRAFDDSVFALDDRCPHKGGPALGRHRPRPQRDLPAARPRHLARDRRGASRRRGPRPHPRRPRRGRPHPARPGAPSGHDRPVRTTCPYCGVGCGILATPDGAGGVAIAGDPDHPANFGRLCSKGSALGQTVSLDGRLLTPRIHGRDASWDEALDLIAARIRAAIDTRGPEASRSTAPASSSPRTTTSPTS